jgi:hypothetical protein
LTRTIAFIPAVMQQAISEGRIHLNVELNDQSTEARSRTLPVLPSSKSLSKPYTSCLSSIHKISQTVTQDQQCKQVAGVVRRPDSWAKKSRPHLALCGHVWLHNFLVFFRVGRQ